MGPPSPLTDPVVRVSGSSMAREGRRELAAEFRT